MPCEGIILNQTKRPLCEGVLDDCSAVAGCVYDIDRCRPAACSEIPTDKCTSSLGCLPSAVRNNSCIDIYFSDRTVTSWTVCQDLACQKGYPCYAFEGGCLLSVTKTLVGQNSNATDCEVQEGVVAVGWAAPVLILILLCFTARWVLRRCEGRLFVGSRTPSRERILFLRRRS
jgi:hypothetical protein